MTKEQDALIWETWARYKLGLSEDEPTPVNLLSYPSFYCGSGKTMIKISEPIHFTDKTPILGSETEITLVDPSEYWERAYRDALAWIDEWTKPSEEPKQETWRDKPPLL